MTITRPAPEFFTALTNLTLRGDQIAPVLSGDTPVPDTAYPMPMIARQLKQHLHLSQDDSARLLGVSRATVTRAAPPTGDILDRLYVLSSRYGLVQDLLGTHADEWFRTPHPALNGRPIDALRTRHGQAQLDDLLQGLIDGNFF
jgi:uncharacterized protein (DUF2384 family)